MSVGQITTKMGPLSTYSQSLDGLPEELLENIASRLNLEDRLSLGKCCKRLHIASRNSFRDVQRLEIRVKLLPPVAPNLSHVTCGGYTIELTLQTDFAHYYSLELDLPDFSKNLACVMSEKSLENLKGKLQSFCHQMIWCNLRTILLETDHNGRDWDDHVIQACARLLAFLAPHHQSVECVMLNNDRWNREVIVNQLNQFSHLRSVQWETTKFRHDNTVANDGSMGQRGSFPLERWFSSESCPIETVWLQDSSSEKNMREVGDIGNFQSLPNALNHLILTNVVLSVPCLSAISTKPLHVLVLDKCCVKVSHGDSPINFFELRTLELSCTQFCQDIQHKSRIAPFYDIIDAPKLECLTLHNTGIMGCATTFSAYRLCTQYPMMASLDVYDVSLPRLSEGMLVESRNLVKSLFDNLPRLTNLREFQFTWISEHRFQDCEALVAPLDACDALENLSVHLPGLRLHLDWILPRVERMSRLSSIGVDLIGYSATPCNTSNKDNATLLRLAEIIESRDPGALLRIVEPFTGFQLAHELGLNKIGDRILVKAPSVWFSRTSKDCFVLYRVK